MPGIEYPNHSDFFCVLGLDVLKKADALRWLTEKRTLFLVDRKPHHAMALFKHPRVRFYCIETPLQEPLIAEDIAWRAVMQNLAIHAEKGWENFQRRLVEDHHGAHLLLSEVSDFGKTALSNARMNWKQKDFRLFAGLKNQFQNIPAIICGAGPSLEKSIPYVAAAHQRALIFSAGTATSILQEQKIASHMAFMLDKETPPSCTALMPFAETVCCFQSRLNPKSVHWMHGEKILSPETGPLPWESWWTNVSEFPSFGWTAANFATETAIWMGCQPIIWVGMDLCYGKNQKYAHRKEVIDKTPLIKIGRKMTQRDWLLSARWSEELSRSHPNIRFINTATQGLPLEAPIETMLPSKIKNLTCREFDIEGRLHQIIQKAPCFKMSEQKEFEWQASVSRCLKICSDFQIHSQKLDSEIVYQIYLEPLWRIWRPIFEREAAGQNLDWHRLLFFQQVLQDGQS